ncbi:MAG: nucleotidyltransferase family protein [Chromatiaceae bacterium]
MEIIYRDLKARHSGDIDLLVAPEDMPRFTRLVRTLGFKVPPDIEDIRDITAANHEFTLTHTAAGFDLHWSLTHPLEEAPVDDASFWRRSEIVTLAEGPCRSLGLEDHLLLLCFHATLHHRFQYVGPRALLDIARVIEQPPRPIDWRDFLARAHDLGWCRGTWLILDLVREHLGVQPPAGVLEGLRPADADDPAIRAAALAAMFLDQGNGQALDHHLVRLVSAATWRESLAILRGRLFPPRRYVASYFGVKIDHPGLTWLYVKRWGMLLKRVTPKVVHLWGGDAGRRAELERTATITAWLRQP